MYTEAREEQGLENVQEMNQEKSPIHHLGLLTWNIFNSARSSQHGSSSWGSLSAFNGGNLLFMNIYSPSERTYFWTFLLLRLYAYYWLDNATPVLKYLERATECMQCFTAHIFVWSHCLFSTAHVTSSGQWVININDVSFPGQSIILLGRMLWSSPSLW